MLGCKKTYLGSVHTHPFSFENAFFFSVFKHIFVHTIAFSYCFRPTTRIGKHDLKTITAYLGSKVIPPTWHQALARPGLTLNIQVLFVFILCQDVSE